MADQTRVAPTSAPDGGELPGEITTVPLMEERLSIAKRQVESGRVRVRVTVEERQETVTEELLHDELQIEHVPKNVRVSEVPRVRLEGNTTIVPVVEEVVVVEKALMLIEEIHVTRRPVPQAREIPVMLRAERATVEREDGAGPTETAE
jgi:uncharacterized protein (TIGR02271 family)